MYIYIARNGSRGAEPRRREYTRFARFHARSVRFADKSNDSSPTFLDSVIGSYDLGKLGGTVFTTRRSDSEEVSGKLRVRFGKLGTPRGGLFRFGEVLRVFGTEKKDLLVGKLGFEKSWDSIVVDWNF